MHGNVSRKGASPFAVLTAVGGLYIAQSVIGGVTWIGLPAIMRSEGVPLDRIGLVSLIVLPWALKFLWSPAVERCRRPASGQKDRRLERSPFPNLSVRPGCKRKCEWRRSIVQYVNIRQSGLICAIMPICVSNAPYKESKWRIAKWKLKSSSWKATVRR